MKWKYLRAQLLTTGKDIDDERFEEFLQDRGDEGWELVSVLQKTVEAPGGLEGQGEFHTFYFKQPL